MPRRKSTASEAAETPPKKRRGRPPKAATTDAKQSAKAPTKSAKAPAKKKKAVSDEDGRRVPVSPATNRAARAAETAIASLKKDRQTLADAQGAAAAARDKARASGARTDKTALKKARTKVQRVSDRVVKARATVRQAKARVVELKARDLLNARLNNVDVRLAQAETIANERIETKLERAVEKFRSAEHAKLSRVEGKKAKQRKLVAEQQVAKLQKEFDERVQAAQESVEPKPRKKRARKTAG